LTYTFHITGKEKGA